MTEPIEGKVGGVGAAVETDAEAESDATVMPWIWGGVGVLVIALFSAWLIFGHGGHTLPHPPAAAPLISKPN